MRAAGALLLYVRDQKIQAVWDSHPGVSDLCKEFESRGEWVELEQKLVEVWTANRYPLQLLREETIQTLHSKRTQYRGFVSLRDAVFNPTL